MIFHFRSFALLHYHECWRCRRVAYSADRDALLDQRAADLRCRACRLVGGVAHGAWGDRGQAVFRIRAAEFCGLAGRSWNARVRGGDALLGEWAADLSCSARRVGCRAGFAGRGQASLGVRATELGRTTVVSVVLMAITEPIFLIYSAASCLCGVQVLSQAAGAGRGACVSCFAALLFERFPALLGWGCHVAEGFVFLSCAPSGNRSVSMLSHAVDALCLVRSLGAADRKLLFQALAGWWCWGGWVRRMRWCRRGGFAEPFFHYGRALCRSKRGLVGDFARGAFGLVVPVYLAQLDKLALAFLGWGRWGRWPWWCDLAERSLFGERALRSNRLIVVRLQTRDALCVVMPSECDDVINIARVSMNRRQPPRDNNDGVPHQYSRADSR